MYAGDVEGYRSGKMRGYRDAAAGFVLDHRGFGCGAPRLRDVAAVPARGDVGGAFFPWRKLDWYGGLAGRGTVCLWDFVLVEYAVLDRDSRDPVVGLCYFPGNRPTGDAVPAVPCSCGARHRPAGDGAGTAARQPARAALYRGGVRIVMEAGGGSLINWNYLLLGGVVLCLSYAFAYGAHLQQEADETL